MCKKLEIMLRLPLELLQDVAQYLTKKDLKVLRSLCRKFARGLGSLLFDSVFLSLDPLDLDKAKKIQACFESSVRTLIICPLMYEPITQRQYEDRILDWMENRDLRGLSRFDKHIERSYEEYVNVWERAGTWDSRQRMQHLFQRLLEIAPKLEKVIFTHKNRHIDTANLDVAKYCPFTKCEYVFPGSAFVPFVAQQWTSYELVTRKKYL